MPTPTEWLSALGSSYKTRNGEIVELHVHMTLGDDSTFEMYGLPIAGAKRQDGHHEPLIRYIYDLDGICKGVKVDDANQRADPAHDLMHHLHPHKNR